MNEENKKDDALEESQDTQPPSEEEEQNATQDQDSVESPEYQQCDGLDKVAEAQAEEEAPPPQRAETYQDRVIKEHDELRMRLDKLRKFMSSYRKEEKDDIYSRLSPDDQANLKRQRAAMEEYLCALDARIASFK